MRRLALTAVLSALATGGCAPRAATLARPVAVPARFASPGGSAALPERWWTHFGDPALDRLAQAALRGNLGLRQAWDRLAQARAVARKSRAGLYPTLDAQGGADGAFQKQGGTYPGQPRPGASGSLWVGLAASYEVDLWGRVRAARDADDHALLATEEDLRAAAISLVGEVATAWFGLAERRQQIRLLEAQRAANAQILALVTLKLQQGQGAAPDLLQQRQLLEAITGERALVTAEARVLEHQLAVLTGLAPGGAPAPASRGLPALPALPAAGLPAALLGRRPDVRAAWRRVLAADRRVAAALADRYPRISLSASTSLTGGYGPALFWTWLGNLAANLVAPLFDGGARRAEVARARAAAAEVVHRYGEVVLAALREVEDALAWEGEQARRVASLEAQRRLSEEAMSEIRARYLQGAEEYLRVLDALLRHQALERALLTARREHLTLRVALCRALAGGFRLPPPSPGGRAG